MTAPVSALVSLPAELPTRRMARRLFRCVPLLAYEKGSPPSFLYTSGRPGRCNPAGVACLYFSESEIIANDEYLLAWSGTPGEHQPKVIYQAVVRLQRVIDLANAAALDALELTAEDLSEPWRGRPQTRLQAVGLAVSRQVQISALRYPSKAARRGNRAGWNVAIFPAAVRAPDRVEIAGPGREVLEVLQ